MQEPQVVIQTLEKELTSTWSCHQRLPETTKKDKILSMQPYLLRLVALYLIIGSVGAASSECTSSFTKIGNLKADGSGYVVARTNPRLTWGSSLLEWSPEHFVNDLPTTEFYHRNIRRCNLYDCVGK